MRAHARVLAGGACVLLAAAVAGCASTASSGSSSVTATGSTLSIYVSVPPGASSDPAEQDVIDAEQLAFTQNKSQVTKYGLRLVLARGAELSDNAREAIQDKSAIAYIGELGPGSSDGTVGITNALDLLQVSPTDTAIELTQSTPAAPGAPSKYYESWSTYGRTFARVVPSAEQEASAQIAEMRSLGVKTLYVASDGSAYGAAIATAVKQDASPAITISSSESGAGGIFYGSDSPAGAAKWFDNAISTDPSAKLFGPSALDSPAFAGAISPQAHHLYISSPGFLPADETAAARSQFVRPFRVAYGHDPAVQAIFGYEAMAAVLHVLAEAGASADNRGTVIHDFFHLSNRSSVLGTYSIDSTGNTSLAPFVFDRLSAGALVPVKSGS